MSACVVDNNNTMMTSSGSSTELSDTNSVVSNPSSTKTGIPAIPKRPTIIRVDKQNVQEENTDESKSREVPKVPPRPPPPRPGPPPVPAKQPAVPKPSEVNKKKKKLEITVVSARPMSEVCFRDKKPEVPVPPRPQKQKDKGEVASVPSANCTNVALSTESLKQTQHSTTDVCSKSSALPPERPRLPPPTVGKKDPPKVAPQRPPPPLRSTLPAPVESSPPPPRPPAVEENSQPHSDPTDPSPHLPKEQSTTQLCSTGGSVTPPKPRPRTCIDTSSKPLKQQRSLSAYKPTKNDIPPRPLPRKHSSSSAVDADSLKTATVEPIAEVVPPPKPSRHQSFRNSTSPIIPSTRPCSSPPSLSQETSSESVPAAEPLPSAKVSTTVDEDVLDPIPAATEDVTPADKTDAAPPSESTETPESSKLEIESSSTDKPAPCPLPPKKNSVVLSQPSLKSPSEDDPPVPSPRTKRSPKPDTPVDPAPATIVSEEPKDFILPSAEEILAPPAATVSKPTIIRASYSTESLQESKSAPNSSEKPPNLDPKDPREKKINRVPPPIPKKNPISANVCDSNIPNGNSSKTVTRPAIPKKPPKPSPPAVAPAKNKQSSRKNSAEKVDGSSSSRSSSTSSSSSNLIKSLIFSKKSGSPSSSSTDLKKSSSVKSRKASEMLQTTKDYTRRITKSLGFTQAEEPSTVWYTDKSEEPEEKTSPSKASPSNKKKETPSIWYVDDEVPEEETDTEKAAVPPRPALQTDKSKKPEKDEAEKLKEMENSLCQPAEEPSPTEVSAFQKYHSYMKRTIEEAVGIIHLSKSTSSLMDEDLTEEKEEEACNVMKPQPVKPAVPEPPKQRPPIPPKDPRPPKPSAPPPAKPTVPAVPPKRPPVPTSVTQPPTKPEAPPVTRPPPPRPKPVVSVKPTVPNNQNITTSDSDINSKNVIKSERRSLSIENLIGKFEEELCKKSVPPPRPAPPVNKAKTVTSTPTDNQDKQLSSENKETNKSADSKTENITDGSTIQPDENENLSVSATEIGGKTGGTENGRTSNLTAGSSIDENANEETEGETGKPQDANSVANVNAELATEETSATEGEQGSHKVGYSDSFNQRCKSLMNDLKIRFDNEEEEGADNVIKEVEVEPESVEKGDAGGKTEEVVKPVVGQSLDQLDVSPEKMQDSSSNEETEEKELEEKVEPPSSEEKSSSHLSLETDTTEVSEKTSQDDSTSQPQSNIVSDTTSCEFSQEVTTLTKELDSNDAGPKEPPKSSITSELTGPRAISNFDFDAQAEDELTLKTPSDTNGNIEITGVSQELAMEEDATKVSSVDAQKDSTQVMDDACQNLSEDQAASATESIKETEGTRISTKEEVSEGVAGAKDGATEDELTDSDQLDEIDIPVGGEETIAYALFDFEGEDGELSFKEGDAITIVKWVNEDWLLGKKEELVGNIPANFVNFTGDSTDELELVDTEDGPPEPKEPPPALQPDVKTDQLLTYVAAQLEHVKRLKGFACARFDFEARDDDELSFKDGDRIEIVEFVNNDWIRGSLHKKEGIFPAAFVSVEEYSPDEEHRTTKCRALHDFTASADDELSFKAGALITCHGVAPNLPGWSNGSFEGKTGMFPTDFVTQEGI